MTSILKKMLKSIRGLMLEKNKNKPNDNESSGRSMRVVRERVVHDDPRRTQLVHLCVSEL